MGATRARDELDEMMRSVDMKAEELFVALLMTGRKGGEESLLHIRMALEWMMDHYIIVGW